MSFKVIHSDNGTLQDHSVSLENYLEGTEVIDYVTAEDFIYFGSHWPFNSFYVDLSVLNTQAATMKVEYWSGTSSEWVEVVEIQDETVGFTKSGYVTYVPDRNEGWVREDTQLPNGNERVTGLGGINVYDRYWMRISFDATLDNTTALNWIGHLFSNDLELYSEYPVFDSSAILTAIKAGKTSWEEQAVRASSLVITELESRGTIEHDGQILDRKKLMTVSVAKTAEIIFSMLGDDYENDRARAENKFKSRISKGKFSIDQNNNATIDVKETTVKVASLYR